MLSTGSQTDVEIKPSYSNWAPWIAPASIDDQSVYNSEYRKCPRYQSAQDVPDDDKELSEEFLVELLCESEVTAVNSDHFILKFHRFLPNCQLVRYRPCGLF